MSKGKLFVGTSGWNYKHWGGGVFYPEGLKPAKWLDYYCQHFNTIEINYSFYRLPERKAFEKWRNSVPDSFTFSVKANRFITHIKRLKEPDKTIPRFLSNASGMGEKLGPILFQFPASFRAEEERLSLFLQYWQKQDIVPDASAALEFRHESWFNDTVANLLREAGAALCLADWRDLKYSWCDTADFVYVRRHGSQNPYTGSYSRSELQSNAEYVGQRLDGGKDVYVYFNNDAHGWAIENALTLWELVAA